MLLIPHGPFFSIGNPEFFHSRPDFIVGRRWLPGGNPSLDSPRLNPQWTDRTCWLFLAVVCNDVITSWARQCWKAPMDYSPGLIVPFDKSLQRRLWTNGFPNELRSYFMNEYANNDHYATAANEPLNASPYMSINMDILQYMCISIAYWGSVHGK